MERHEGHRLQAFSLIEEAAGNTSAETSQILASGDRDDEADNAVSPIRMSAYVEARHNVQPEEKMLNIFCKPARRSVVRRVTALRNRAAALPKTSKQQGEVGSA